MKKLWEILVPTIYRPTGKPIHTRFHRVWDQKVRAITGGLTTFQPVKGQWISPDNHLFNDRMIPVRVLATEDEIKQIVTLTGQYYKELAVMYYLVSEYAVITRFPEND